MTAIAVVGAGPLGASTAYHLARGGASVTVVSDAGSSDAAYHASGGSVCWHRPDPRRAALIRQTAEFVRAAVAAGAPIRCRDTPYLFLTEGVLVPALNIGSADLVSYLLAEAERSGAERADVGRVVAVERSGDHHVVRGDRGTLAAGVVVLAMGTGNREVLPGLDGTWEKRQLFVLDLAVDDHRAALPHTVAAVDDGYAYVFVKEFDEGLRVVVGQEDVVEDHDHSGPVDHLAALLDRGVGALFPFLRDAAVERVLWGLDWADKLPHLSSHGAGILSINCGSAVRACVPAGQATAEAAMRALEASI